MGTSKYKDTLFIDLDKVVKEKMGRKARFLPQFVLSFLKRLVRQDELNAMIAAANGKQGVDFMEHCMDYMHNKVVVKGLENLPKNGTFTFVSNHPLGGQDGIIICYVLGRHYNGRIKCIVNDLLMALSPLRDIFVPTSNIGKQTRAYSQRINELFRSEENLLIFPAGICSRKQNGVISDLAWKKSFITKSLEHHRDVVPMYFEGRNSSFFYNLANWCKRLHIKFNVAMLFLPDEMLKNKNKIFRLTIGEPIPWQTFDDGKTPVQWAQHVKEIVYNLK
ncbi:MAG: 1-acyl-sn-glycerol-3-phosphate acyltransferase [Bacteroidales bacterium]|nr:1-acyl-sn-glycerol-3-phosphate acyltransferase [Bacteroidales bacterium]